MSSPIPTVSIGMPVYNGEAFVREAIESFLGQTYGDFELIISDNASDDATETICREYQVKDRRIRYNRNAKNFGSYFNDRKVIDLARGKYFKWSSCNDAVDSHYLAAAVTALEADPTAVLCHSRTRMIDCKGTVIRDIEDRLDLTDEIPAARFKKLFDRMRLNNVFSGVIRADVLRQTSYLGTYIASDIAVIAELSLRGKFVELPEYLFYRRMGKEASTRGKTIGELLTFHDPNTVPRKRPMVNWRLNCEFFRSVAKSPISLWEKLKLFVFLSKNFIWSRKKLTEELKELVSGIISSPLHKP